MPLSIGLFANVIAEKAPPGMNFPAIDLKNGLFKKIMIVIIPQPGKKGLVNTHRP